MMNNKEIYDELCKIIEPSNIKTNESMKKHTSFKIGGNADFFVIAKNVEDIRNVLKFTKTNEVSLTIIGNGSNILVSDNGIRGIVLQINLQGIEIEKEINDIEMAQDLDCVAEEEENYTYNRSNRKSSIRSKTWIFSTECY